MHMMIKNLWNHNVRSWKNYHVMTMFQMNKYQTIITTIHKYEWMWWTLTMFFKNNQPCELAFINLSKKPMEILPITPITLGNIRVKHKHCIVFLPIIEITTKNNKIMVTAMDCLNTTQLEIEDRRINCMSKPSLNKTST